MNKPLKILAVGDIHAKPRIITLVEKIADKYDYVVFLGDYIDDWDAPPDMNYQTLERLINFKKRYPEKVILLLGNHCLSEYLAGDFRCSGFSGNTHQLVKELYRTKINDVPIFQPATSLGGILFTHAGVTKSYWNDLQILIKNHYPQYQKLASEHEISIILNHAWLEHFINPDDQLFLTFSQAGPARGGVQTPSFVWADKTELEQDYIPGLHQVVGHTPVNTTLIQKPDKKTTLCFCDTHSYSYIPLLGGVSLPIGDSSCLEIQIGTYRKYERIYF